MRLILLAALLVAAAGSLPAKENATAITAPAGGGTAAAARLADRVLGKRASSIAFEQIAQENGRDVFEIESAGNKIVVRGSTGVAMASGLNYYLKYHCHASVSVRGDQLNLPKRLPVVQPKVRHVSPYKYRYCFNYCTFGYALAFWDWPEWQRLIDWMAMNGINAPLALTGQEAIWDKVYSGMGLTKKEIREFLPGPAFFPWHYMGGLDGWGGPLPDSWMQSHLALQQKIVARERELGMTPILQAFSGHVPGAIQRVFPDAKLNKLSWCGFPSTYMLDPTNPAFKKIGQAFVEEEIKQFGTDHLYAADTFNEIVPPTNDPKWLGDATRMVYDGMTAADPEATWFMQGWIFVGSIDWWQRPQREAVFHAVPDGRLIMLDMDAGIRPVWPKTDVFSGLPWAWCIISDFGGCVSLHGMIGEWAGSLDKTLKNPACKRLVGLGIAMESITYNPVLYDFMSDMAWRSDVPDLDKWFPEAVTARYGQDIPEAQEAWRLLRKTAYTQAERNDTAICFRPPGGGWVYVGTPYNQETLADAWKNLLACSDKLNNADTYRFDLVNVSRQVLGAMGNDYARACTAAYEKRDRMALLEATAKFVGLINDIDELLATRREFLLGRWLEAAKRWGTNDEERRLMEWNARAQITFWGIKTSGLNEYAHKEWSGMFKGFYGPRWELYLRLADEALAAGKSLDDGVRDKAMLDYDYGWANKTETYPTEPHGDPIEVARKLWAKYKGGSYDPASESGSSIKGAESMKWSLANSTETEQILTWDVTEKLKALGAGTYTVQVEYLRGAKAIMVRKVELLQKARMAVNSTSISVDEHPGRSGVVTKDNVYTFELKKLEAHTNYILQIFASGDGGNDSQGRIVISKK